MSADSAREWTTLGDIAEVIGGGTPRTSDPSNFDDGAIPWITPADLSGYTAKYISGGARFITKKGLDSSSARLLPAGTVLFSSRAPIGYVAIADKPVATNQGFKSFVLRPGVLPEYVYWWLKGSKRTAESLASGTTFLELSGANAKRLPIPLVPIDEQRRIVAEIEKQFSRLDEAVANLQRVKAKLQRYARTVLNAAVAGRLVPGKSEGSEVSDSKCESGSTLLQRLLRHRRDTWTGPRHYKEPAPQEARDWNPPEGWVMATIEQLSSGEQHSLAIGPFGSSLKVSDYTQTGVPLVFVRNIRAKRFEDDGGVFVSLTKAHELRAHSVSPGDVLITKMGDPPGDVCIYPGHRPPAVITADCIKIRPSPLLDGGKYLAYAIESQFVQRQILGATKGVAQLKVSLGRFSTIVVPLPPIAEQHRIVAEVDRRLSIVREVEAEVDANLKRAQALRQAVLSQAFAANSSC